MWKLRRSEKPPENHFCPEEVSIQVALDSIYRNVQDNMYPNSTLALQAIGAALVRRNFQLAVRAASPPCRGAVLNTAGHLVCPLVEMAVTAAATAHSPRPPQAVPLERVALAEQERLINGGSEHSLWFTADGAALFGAQTATYYEDFRPLDGPYL